MKLDGWTPLGQLKVGDRIAAPRRVPEPVDTHRMAESEVILLAHMIGDGSCVKRQPIRYASVDEANLAAVTVAATHFGVRAIRDDYPAARVTTLRLPSPVPLARGRRNPIAPGSMGWAVRRRSYEKFVHKRCSARQRPGGLVPSPPVGDRRIGRWDATTGQGRIYYASTSRRLIDDVAALLLRVGVFGRIKRARKLGYRDCWHLYIYGAQNQVRFLQVAGVHGEKAAAVQEVLLQLEGVVRNPNLDTVPTEV